MAFGSFKEQPIPPTPSGSVRVDVVVDRQDVSFSDLDLDTHVAYKLYVFLAPGSSDVRLRPNNDAGNAQSMIIQNQTGSPTPVTVNEPYLPICLSTVFAGTWGTYIATIAGPTGAWKAYSLSALTNLGFANIQNVIDGQYQQLGNITELVAHSTGPGDIKAGSVFILVPEVA